MGERTGIEWCDSTATPVIGCWPVSPGCANCWARHDTPARVLRAGKWPGHPEPFETWTKDGPRYRVKGFADALRRMNARPWVCNKCGLARTGLVKYGKCVRCDDECAKFHRRRVFIGDSCDLLDPAWSAEWLAETLWQMSLAPDVVQILCTKRPELFAERMLAALNSAGGKWGTAVCEFIQGWKCGARVPQNVCVLASAENQEMAEARIPELLRIPARWHGLSLEPLLGPVDVLPWLCAPSGKTDGFNPGGMRVVGADLNWPQLDWLIIGGESGPNARPCNVEWVRSLVQQGNAAGVPVFVKQLGARPVGRWTESPERSGLGEGWPAGIKITHSKGGDPSEWPDDLRVQQWPVGM